MSARGLWRRFLFLCRRSRMTEDLEEEMRLHTELRKSSIISRHGPGCVVDLSDDVGLRKIGFYTREVDLQVGHAHLK